MFLIFGTPMSPVILMCLLHTSRFTLSGLPSHIKSHIAFSALVITYSGTCNTLKAHSNVLKPTDFTISDFPYNVKKRFFPQS